MDSVPDLIEFKDARGRFVSINRALSSRLGLMSPEDAIGKAESELDEAEYASEALLEDQSILRSGRPLPAKLQRRRWLSGQEDWLLTTKFPLHDLNGDAVVGTLGVHRNVTAQKHAEDQAMESVRRRDDFMAMLSHELRNPLSAITTASSMLARSPSGQASDYVITVIQRQSAQMARLLDDLLDVSRVVQNKIELQRTIVDLRSLVDEVIAAAQHVFAESRVKLEMSVAEGGLWVDGDPTRIQQLILNLLVNAAKYNSPGGHAWLEMTREGMQIVIRIRDDGLGIEPSLQQQIFEPFVQSETTLARSRGGMGLGLTLVKSIVELHGGNVRVKSDGPGRGSEFEVRLPAVPMARPVVSDGQPKPVPLDDSMQVVIVEDRSDIRESLRMLLESHGLKVDTACDGEEGVDLILRLKPSVALVDIGLPKVDGYEVARRVRETIGRKGTRLVALTGYGQHQDRDLAIASGFDEHLVKPIDPEVLRRFLLGTSIEGD
jgi:two-component system, chemotaxis family, CheB/CheR fusion protein